MTRYSIINSFYSLIFIFVCLRSCTGQVKPSWVSDFKNNNPGKPKLIKTLSSNQAENVHCGLQDKAGNLWFGTTGSGVYQFDGKIFYNYTKKDGLSSNTVYSTLEDTSGNIWFGTDAGLSKYDGKKITTIPLTTGIHLNTGNVSAINALHKNNVWSILQDKRGTIWFGTDDGLFCLSGQKFNRFLDNPGIINKSNLTLKSIQCMLEDKNGNIWFGSGPMAFEGICIYDGKSLHQLKLKDEGWIRKIIEDKTGSILFATRHLGAYSYDGKDFSEMPKPRELKNELLNTILVDSKGNTWYASDYVNNNDFTAGGVWKYNEKSFVEFTPTIGLANTAVFFMMEDKLGNIWLGTRNTGLFRFDGNTITSFAE